MFNIRIPKSGGTLFLIKIIGHFVKITFFTGGLLALWDGLLQKWCKSNYKCSNQFSNYAKHEKQEDYFLNLVFGWAESNLKQFTTKKVIKITFLGHWSRKLCVHIRSHAEIPSP